MHAFIDNCQGAVFLCLVIVIWVASAILIRAILTSQDDDGSQFEKPLFLTYFSTSFFMVYLIPMGIKFFRLRSSATNE